MRKIFRYKDTKKKSDLQIYCKKNVKILVVYALCIATKGASGRQKEDRGREGRRTRVNAMRKEWLFLAESGVKIGQKKDKKYIYYVYIV